MTNSEDSPAEDAGSSTTAEGDASAAIEATSAPSASSPLLFHDLSAPQATDPTPPVGARVLAFGSILLGGLLGALIGYGTADLMAESSVVAALGGLIGAAAGAIGVGVVASLTLRAMNEWHATQHPEDERTIAEHRGDGETGGSDS
jgi:hypothetical protein